MDVSIISWKECIFAQRAENMLINFLETLQLEGQKIDLRLKSYDLKAVEHQMIAAEVHRCKLQIVIISNHFLLHLRSESNVEKKLSPINRVLRSKRVIAILVSLTVEDMAECYQNLLAKYDEWYVVELKSSSTSKQLDAEFCTKLTNQIGKIYNAELSSISNFKIFPTKVTRDQPKLVLMFKEPISPESSFRVELSSKGGQTEIISELPTSNPFTASLRLPSVVCTKATRLIEITPFVNGQKMGTKLLKYEHQSKSVETDAAELIDRMSQALPGFLKLLDEHISEALTKNFRLCEDISLDPSLELMNDALICREDDFPTVMHFACNYGLESTVSVLLHEGDGLEQCSIRNDMNETPMDIAKAKGVESICEMIKDYQEVIFTWKAVQYMKDLYERHSEELEKAKLEQAGIQLGKEEDNGQLGSKSSSSSLSDDSSKEGTDEGQNKEIQSAKISNGCVSLTETETEGDTTPEIDDRVQEEPFTNIRISKVPTNKMKTEARSKRQTNSHLLVQQQHSEHPEYLMMGGAGGGAGAVMYDTPPSIPRKAAGAGTIPNNEYCVLSGGGRSQTNMTSTTAINSSSSQEFLVRKGSAITHGSDGYIMIQSTEKITSTRSLIGADFKPPEGPLLSPESKPIYPNVTHPGICTASTSKGIGNLPHTPTPQKPLVLDPSDENLVELMKDFKDNVYSMSQLELLFENWKSRSDVQSDMKERQKELKRIRDDYKKIQEAARKSNKKTSLKWSFPGRKKQSSAGLPLVEEKGPTPKVTALSASGGDSPQILESTTSSDSDTTGKNMEKEKPETVPFWKNPHDDRFFTSYVSPNTVQEEPILSPEVEGPPPPRPAKKVSTTLAPIFCQSPPASPLIRRVPPPPPPTSPHSPPITLAHQNGFSRTGSKKKPVKTPPPSP